MKKILIILCFSYVLWGYVFADDELLGDCSLFQGQSSFSVPFVDSFDIETLYPTSNRQIALENLRAYCCSQSNLKPPKSQCENTSKNFAFSNQLYDHLVDVGFRALDGDPNLQYEGKTYEGFTIDPVMDPVGVEWFNKLYNEENGYAINPLGEIPLKIRKDFGTYWGLGENGSVQYDLHEFKNPKNNTGQYSTYIQKREKIPSDENSNESIGLASRYLIICHIAQSLHPKQPRYTAGFDNCKKIAMERIHGEIAYVQYLLSHQGITALMANFNAYTQGYLVQSEMNRLLEKFTEMNAGLTHINSKVSEMTKMCSD